MTYICIFIHFMLYYFLPKIYIFFIIYIFRLELTLTSDMISDADIRDLFHNTGVSI